MAEWTEPTIEDELRAVLRREVGAQPLTVTVHDVLARRRASRQQVRRPWIAVLAAAFLMVPLSLAAVLAVLSPADESPYRAVLARGLSTTDFRTPNEHVPDLELVLVRPDGYERSVISIPASRFGGWKTTRRYGLSPDGRWLAMTLQDASSDDPRPEAPPLAVIDLQHPDHVRLVTGGRLEPVWAPDGSLWWSVAGQLQQVDLATGALLADADPATAPATRPPAIAEHLDEIDADGNWPYGSGDWEIRSMTWAADGGTWLLVRRDRDRSYVYRLVHRDPDGTDRVGPDFESHGSMGLEYDALAMAPDDALAAIRDHDSRRVSGEISPGRTQILDVHTTRGDIHTGWLVGFVRADAAAMWGMTEGGSR